MEVQRSQDMRTEGVPALSAELSQVPVLAGDEQHDLDQFPPGKFDLHGQQIDKRTHNTWAMRL